MKLYKVLFILIFISFETSRSQIANSNDGCANIHNDYIKGIRLFNYTDVSNCYKSIPFDRSVANQTIQTINELFNGFYSFLDIAREPPPNGFNFSSINITSELNRLLNNNTYGSLFQFMTDVRNVTSQLKDAHAKFVTSCFTTFAFFSNFTLYSVVGTNGTQIIKVRNDTIDPSNNNCEVILIDGIQAFKVIYEFARDSVFISKDIGVRFNLALDLVDAENSFSYRMNLPPTLNITYRLNCSNNIKDVNRVWIAMSLPEILNQFNDSKSFYKNRCNITTTNQTMISLYQREFHETKNLLHVKRDNSILDVTQEYKGDHDNWQPTNVTVIGVVQDFISFFIKDNFGVIKIFSEQITFNDSVAINTIKGFENLANSGVKKIVIDLSNNFGGSIAVSAFINLILFPNNPNPFFDYDLRVTDSIRFALENGILFNINETAFSSIKTKFQNINDFIGNNSYSRGNVMGRYSNKFVPDILSLLTNFIAQYLRIPLPWKSKDIIILTNGVCGSACALIARHAVENNNVSTVAVGGLVNSTNLSYSSFPGGVYIDSSTIFKLNSPNNTLIPKPFPLNAYITLPFTEVYSRKQPDKLLEFLYSPANFTIFYDEQSIQDQSILWSKAASYIGKT
ncbi:peptidase s41 family protein [Gigaspora margarita]|uniref:Peptidase s41 family protein n=1 Tax=Gigaspora margarita TaxID=4874 RepID=A0A8H4AP88_GIGMA|nr:peptidase s41 family protein [Gigaspora margarita]